MPEYRLIFEETYRYTIKKVDATDPADAEDEVREHWDFYTAANNPNGSTLTLIEVRTTDAQDAERDRIPDEPPF